MRQLAVLTLAICLLWLPGRSLSQDSGVSQLSEQQFATFEEKMRTGSAAERIELLGMAVGHRMYSPERALELAREITEQPVVQADKASHARGLLFLATCHFGLRQLDDAQAVTDAAEKVAADLEDLDLKFNIACRHAFIQRERHGVSTAISRLADFRTSVLGQQRHEAICANLMGMMASANGNTTEAISFFLEAHDLAIAAHDPTTAAGALNRLGRMQTQLGLLDTGRKTLQQSLAICDLRGLDNLIAVKIGLAENTLARGDPHQALVDIEELIKGAGTERYHATVDSRRLKAEALLSLGHVSDAESLVNKGLNQLAPRQPSYYRMLITKAKVLSAQGDHGGALEELGAVMAETKATMKRLYFDAAQQRALAFQRQGHDDKALAAMQALSALRASHRAEEAAEQVSVGIAVEQKKRELAALEQDRRDAEYKAAASEARLWSLALLAVLASLSIGLYARKRIVERERQTTQLLADRTQEMNTQLQQDLREKSAELKEEIETKAELERALQHTRQIEALGSLTSGVAHDFNNLMTVVLSSNETLRLTAADRLEERELAALDESTKAAKSGAIITRQLLQMSRVKPDEPKRLHVPDFMEDIRGLLVRTLGETVRLEIECLDPTAAVFVDDTRLTTSLMNLCANARDAQENRGVVRLQVKTGIAANHDFLLGIESMHPQSRFVFIEVSDDGCGMTPDALARAMEPLFTTKPESKGTGLGLSVVRSFAHEAGGLLHLESAHEVGTRATIVLPVCMVGEIVQSKREDEKLPDLAELSVVVVDDKESVLTSVARVLLTLGCSVDRYSDAAEVHEHFLYGQRPDVLLTDIRMPGRIDGLDLAEWVRVRYPKTGIVLMTGHSEAQSSDFVTLAKPFSVSELAVSLSSEIAKAKTRTTTADAQSAVPPAASPVTSASRL